MFKSVLIITLFWASRQAQAHEAEEGRIYLSLGSYTYQTQFKNERGEVEAPVQGSVGFTVNGDVDSKSGIEVGGFFVDKVFMREKGANVLVEKIKRVYMTIGYRHWFTNRLGLGISSFTSYSLGGPSRIYSTTGGDPGFETSAHDTSDHGVNYSMLYEIYSHNNDIGLIDLRYSRSWSSREGEDGDQAGIFIAYKQRTK